MRQVIGVVMITFALCLLGFAHVGSGVWMMYEKNYENAGVIAFVIGVVLLGCCYPVMF